MANFGLGPFSNDIAADFIGDMAGRCTVKERTQRVEAAMRDYLESPHLTGQPAALEPVDPRSMQEMVEQIGSLDAVIEMLGLIDEKGVYFIVESRGAQANAALAAAALVALAIDGELSDMDGDAAKIARSLGAGALALRSLAHAVLDSLAGDRDGLLAIYESDDAGVQGLHATVLPMRNLLA